MLLQFRRRDRRRLQASFRRGTSYPFRRLGFRQSSFRHITRIFPARRPYAWARPPVSWHAIVPFTFRILGQPLDPEISPLISARCAGDIALRLVAQQQQRAATSPPPVDVVRSAWTRWPAPTTFNDLHAPRW